MALSPVADVQAPPVPRRRRADAITVRTTRSLGPAAGLHTDATAMLLFIVRGTGWYRHGDRTAQVGPGSLWVLMPDEVHDTEGLRATEGWVVGFRPEAVGVHVAFPSVLATAQHPPWTVLLRPACLRGTLEVPPEARPHWDRRLRELAHELRTRPTGYGHAMQAHLTLMLVDVARLSFSRLSGPAQHSEPVLADLFAIIDARYSEPLTLEDLAREVALSPRHLTRIVRRLTGATVLQWLVERRMVEARRLLLETDLPIERVARAVGYRDPGHFRRQFGQEHGAAPSRWRRAAHGQLD